MHFRNAICNLSPSPTVDNMIIAVAIPCHFIVFLFLNMLSISRRLETVDWKAYLDVSILCLSVNCLTIDRHYWLTQLTRRDTSLTFLPTTPKMSAHKSMSITIEILLTHFLHWQSMTCQGQQNVAVDSVSTQNQNVPIMLWQVTCWRHIQLSCKTEAGILGPSLWWIC
jgi:hypothetical protein